MNKSGLKKSHFFISRRKNAENCVPTNHENQFTTRPLYTCTFIHLHNLLFSSIH